MAKFKIQLILPLMKYFHLPLVYLLLLFIIACAKKPIPHEDVAPESATRDQGSNQILKPTPQGEGVAVDSATREQKNNQTSFSGNPTSNFIERQVQRPEITAIIMPSAMPIGNSEKMKIYVTDYSTIEPPHLEFNILILGNPALTFDLLPHVLSFSKRRMISESSWEFEYDIRIDSREMSQLSVVASSAVNRLDRLNRHSVMQKTLTPEPLGFTLIGPKYITVYRGRRNHISFQVIGGPYKYKRLSALLLDQDQIPEGHLEFFKEERNNNLHAYLIWDLPLGQRRQPSELYDFHLWIEVVREFNGTSILESHRYVINVKISDPI